jgi:hypothetical protein
VLVIKPSASRFFAAWPPPHGGACPRNFNIIINVTSDMRESVRIGVRDARRAAPRPRAGLGRDVRHVGACARGAPARPRTWDDGVNGKLLSHLLFCASWCTTTRRKGRRCCASVAAPCEPRAYPLRGPLVWSCGPLRATCHSLVLAPLRSRGFLAVFVGMYGWLLAVCSGRRKSQLCTGPVTARQGATEKRDLRIGCIAIGKFAFGDRTIPIHARTPEGSALSSAYLPNEMDVYSLQWCTLTTTPLTP